MTRTQPPIHSPRLPINITRLLTRQKQRHARNLIRHRAPPQRIQLPDLPLTVPGPRGLVQRRRHAGLD